MAEFFFKEKKNQKTDIFIIKRGKAVYFIVPFRDKILEIKDCMILGLCFRRFKMWYEGFRDSGF